MPKFCCNRGSYWEWKVPFCNHKLETEIVNLSRGRILTYAALRLSGRWASYLYNRVIEPYYYCSNISDRMIYGRSLKSLDDVGLGAGRYRFRFVPAAYKSLMKSNTFYFIGRGECRLHHYELSDKNILCLEERKVYWGRVKWIPVQIPSLAER